MKEDAKKLDALRRLIELGDTADSQECLKGNESEADETLRLLQEQLASLDAEREQRDESPHRELREALSAGDIGKVAALIEAGADIQFRDEEGYNALLHAIHGRDVVRDPRLLELLNLLIAHDVELSGVTTYSESGPRVLSRIGRFDAVQLLLGAGADASHLKWTPLIKAVALGSLADVQALLLDGVSLEDTDYWERTAWLVAIQTGDIPKANLLRENGANTRACGRCGKPPLFYAIENHHVDMLRWLYATGSDPEQTDEFGQTCLTTAVECDDLECVDTLLAAGVDVDRTHHESTALNHVLSRPVAMRLLAAGANPAGLSHEGRRSLVGLSTYADENLLEGVAEEDFRRARSPRYGTANPEQIQEPFWEAMIRSGVTGYVANERFGGPSSFEGNPVWCAQRFGQTVTLLPNGCAVQIAGEHEDHYDPDFHIYNDVFVHEPDGNIRIFGYPETVFPPTDFHTATLVEHFIYIIGSLGYGRTPILETPIFRLDTRTFAMERLRATGVSPGWIHRHRATLTPSREIVVRGGEVVRVIDGKQVHEKDSREFILNLERMHWRVA